MDNPSSWQFDDRTYYQYYIFDIFGGTLIKGNVVFFNFLKIIDRERFTLPWAENLFRKPTFISYKKKFRREKVFLW